MNETPSTFFQEKSLLWEHVQVLWTEWHFLVARESLKNVLGCLEARNLNNECWITVWRCKLQTVMPKGLTWPNVNTTQARHLQKTIIIIIIIVTSSNNRISSSVRGSIIVAALILVALVVAVVIVAAAALILVAIVVVVLVKAVYVWRIKDQLDVTCYFISLLMCSTCFAH